MRLYTSVFLLLSLLALAPAAARVDSNYVKTFQQRVTVRLYSGEKISIFDLRDNNTGRTLQYRPNNILSLGAGFTIQGVGINLSVPMPFHDRKFDKFGRSNRLDVQVHSYQPKIMIDGYFQRYKGMHLNSTDPVISLTGPELYPYFPRMYSTTLGLTGLFVFNGERYSMGAAFNQQTRQLRSAGSFLAGISGFVHFFNDDSSLLYERNRYTDMFEGRTPRSLGMYAVNLHGGYGYNVVFDRKARWFAGLAVDLGIGLAYTTATDIDFRYETRISPNFAGNVRFGAGYNDDKWFAGVFGTAHSNYYNLPYENTTAMATQGIVRATVARRIFTRNRFLARQPDQAPLLTF
jgi:hypothetical protein